MKLFFYDYSQIQGLPTSFTESYQNKKCFQEQVHALLKKQVKFKKPTIIILKDSA